MKIVSKNIFLFPLLVLILLGLENQSLGQVLNVRLEWKRIPNATGYIIVFKNSDGKIFMQKKVKTNHISVNLPYDLYEYRIGAINIVEKVASWSHWRSIRFREFELPYISYLDKKILYRQNISENLIIKGGNFTKFSKITILNDLKEVRVFRINPVNSNVITIKVRTKLFAPGIYSLKVENPGNKRALCENCLEIR